LLICENGFTIRRKSNYYIDDGRRRKTNRRRNGARKVKKDIPVAPILGPIFAKDGFVPVVPLNSYHVINNGSYYQIPVRILHI